MSLNTTTEIKKEQNIRIKDLCPEEKRKIGELLKKLSNETEEKEKLQTMLQEDSQSRIVQFPTRNGYDRNATC